MEELEDKLYKLQDKLDKLDELDEITEEINNKIENLQKDIFRIEDKISDITSQIEELEEEENEPVEIYEWWMVLDFLCRKLKEHGEVVIPHANIWGRSTTGQAIFLDGVISRICKEMEILEGQKYEWDVD